MAEDASGFSSIFQVTKVYNFHTLRVNPFANFPIEIVSAIVGLLSPADIMAARDVCEEWQRKIDVSITRTHSVHDFTFAHRINQAEPEDAARAYRHLSK